MPESLIVGSEHAYARGESNQTEAQQPGAWPQTFHFSEADLVFDSRVQTPSVGLRAAGRPGRRVLFQNRDAEIDLEMTQTSGPERVRLMGQITPGAPNASGGWLRLARGYDRWLIFLDESGEFQVDGLEPGYYELEVIYKHGIVAVPVLPISAGLLAEPALGQP